MQFSHLSTLATDSSGQLDVLRHDGYSLGVDGAQVGVFEQADQVGFGGLLQGDEDESCVSAEGVDAGRGAKVRRAIGDTTNSKRSRAFGVPSVGQRARREKKRLNAAKAGDVRRLLRIRYRFEFSVRIRWAHKG